MRPKDNQKITRLFEGALRLVEQVGLAGLTMALVAKEAGLAVGTAYIYFTNKQELLTSLYKEVKRRFQHQVFTNLLAPDMPIREQLFAIWQNYLQYTFRYYQEAVFLQQFNRSPYVREKETWLFATGIMQPLTQLLQQGQQQGVLKSDPAQLTLHLLAGFIDELAAAQHERRLGQPDEAVSQGFRFFWDSIKS